MNALAIVINVVLILISIVLIVAVLMQQGQRQGLGAIGGGAETFFGKNKSKGYEAKMAKITKIGAAVFIVLAIVATIMTSRGVNRDDAVGEIPGVEELTPTEVPAGGATEVPAELPAEIPAEAAEVPTEAPAAATEAPTEAPATNG